MAVLTAGVKKPVVLTFSGMIQWLLANIAVHTTSMSITSYWQLRAWRFATSVASWPLDVCGR